MIIKGPFGSSQLIASIHTPLVASRIGWLPNDHLELKSIEEREE